MPRCTINCTIYTQFTKLSKITEKQNKNLYCALRFEFHSKCFASNSNCYFVHTERFDIFVLAAVRFALTRPFRTSTITTIFVCKLSIGFAANWIENLVNAKHWAKSYLQKRRLIAANHLFVFIVSIWFILFLLIVIGKCKYRRQNMYNSL